MGNASFVRQKLQEGGGKKFKKKTSSDMRPEKNNTIKVKKILVFSDFRVIVKELFT